MISRAAVLHRRIDHFSTGMSRWISSMNSTCAAELVSSAARSPAPRSPSLGVLNPTPSRARHLRQRGLRGRRPKTSTWSIAPAPARRLVNPRFPRAASCRLTRRALGASAAPGPPAAAGGRGGFGPSGRTLVSRFAGMEPLFLLHAPRASGHLQIIEARIHTFPSSWVHCHFERRYTTHRPIPTHNGCAERL